MNPLFLGPLLDMGKTLLDRFFPDEEARRQAEADFMVMIAKGDMAQALAQIEVNAKEASSPSTFVAGWRPAVGWIGAFGLFYATIGQGLLVWASGIWHFPPPPAVDTDTLVYILGSMLGIGGLRSYEKIKGVAAK